MGQDPLGLVLRSARRVGNEFCWPASQVVQVLRAFERLGRVVLGAELWRFDDDGIDPTVLGWTQFDVPEGTREQRVAESIRLAAGELAGHMGDRDLWVNLTWEDGGLATH